MQERITHALLLLQEECIRVKEACYYRGFTDPNYFERTFMKVTGVTPEHTRLKGLGVKND